MQSWQTELEQLNLIASDLPSTISLRLDANQSWNEQQATTILKQLIGIPIESIEEPLLHPDFATLDKLQTMIPFAIALDETLPKIAQQIFTNMYCPVRRLIIKPSVIGGLRQAFNWIQQAQQCKLEWVITSTLESGIGVLAAAHLAAALQAKLAQGLATTVWFTQDIIPPLNINNGVLIL
jgi:L-alanine-DL-glutamate epimerase-like enolase superfamily enzyme